MTCPEYITVEYIVEFIMEIKYFLKLAKQFPTVFLYSNFKDIPCLFYVKTAHSCKNMRMILSFYSSCICNS